MTRSISSSSCRLFSGAHRRSTNFCGRYLTFSSWRACRNVCGMVTVSEVPSTQVKATDAPTIGLLFAGDRFEAFDRNVSEISLGALVSFGALKRLAPPAKATTSASALFPEPRGPIIATRSRLSGMGASSNHPGTFDTRTLSMIWKLCFNCGGWSPMNRRSLGS